MLCLLFYNLYTISISHSHKKTIVNNHLVITSHHVYNYEIAFKTAKEYGYAGSTVTLGVTYGILNEVLYGYSLIETKKQLEIQKKFNDFEDNNIDSLVKNENIKLVLLSDFSNKKEYICTKLIKNGFKEWKKFSNEKTADEIIALVRSATKEIK